VLVGCGGGGGGGGNDCTPPSVSVTGSWSGTWRSQNGVDAGTMSFLLNQNGTALEGEFAVGGSPCWSGGTVSGNVCGDTISGSLSAGGIRVDVAATVTGTQMNGTYNAVSAGACSGDTGTFSAGLGGGASDIAD